MRYLVIVDGDHYPPVVRGALDGLEAAGHTVAGVVLAGGTEKLPAGGVPDYGAAPLRTGDDPLVELDLALTQLAPDAVLDYADEPALHYRRRHELAAVALTRGVPYEGADFLFSPPPRPRVAARPSVAIIGTGKRTGKTAVGGLAARTLKGAGHRPVLVAMGRGGPAEPEIMRGDLVQPSPSDLLALADDGKHAASDYIEDALTARVPTVGGHRCGGGLAGGVAVSNMPAAVAKADEIAGDLMILEGSGSAIPPVHADVTVLVVPASVALEHLSGYMGPYRLLLADFALVTMCEEPFGSASQVSAVTSLLQGSFAALRGGRTRQRLQVARTVFRPTPLCSVEGASVLVVTTAPEMTGGSITDHLERQHGCKVVGVSHSLSNRTRLTQELESHRKGADIVLCELKAAAIDVVTRWAIEAGLPTAYMDNVPHGVDGDDPSSVFVNAAAMAKNRFSGSEA